MADILATETYVHNFLGNTATYTDKLYVTKSRAIAMGAKVTGIYADNQLVCEKDIQKSANTITFYNQGGTIPLLTIEHNSPNYTMPTIQEFLQVLFNSAIPSSLRPFVGIPEQSLQYLVYLSYFDATNYQSTSQCICKSPGSTTTITSDQKYWVQIEPYIDINLFNHNGRGTQVGLFSNNLGYDAFIGIEPIIIYNGFRFNSRQYTEDNATVYGECKITLHTVRKNNFAPCSYQGTKQAQISEVNVFLSSYPSGGAITESHYKCLGSINQNAADLNHNNCFVHNYEPGSYNYDLQYNNYPTSGSSFSIPFKYFVSDSTSVTAYYLTDINFRIFIEDND